MRWNEGNLQNTYPSICLYVIDFMREWNFLTNDVGKTFILSNGKDSTDNDYILYHEQFHDAVLLLEN